MTEHRKQFLESGYTVVRQYLSTSDMERLDRRVAEQAPDQSLRHQYSQSSDPKRYEYSLSRAVPDDGKRKREGTESDTFQLESLTALVKDLCPDLMPAECFCIVSEPGSEDQPAHTDSIPTDESDSAVTEWQSTLHYIGILIPLQNTDDRCGKTAVIPGSHKPGIVVEKEEHVSLSRGDILVLDGRTVHRGLANKQTPNNTDPTIGVRRICFFTYTRPDITDGNALAYEIGNVDIAKYIGKQKKKRKKLRKTVS
mmetsp:Transcript_24791/g.36568  ORF Transcript_24791/g.36568 Transcript_24791/m.36568 type:complete len:254 (+) Transcript_24791:74-835(+)